MSLKQVYQSDTLYYEPSPSTPHYGTGPSQMVVSNPGLRVPPRLYDEGMVTWLANVVSIMCRQDAYGNEFLSVLLILDYYYNDWPMGGIHIWLENFDPVAGAYLGRDWAYYGEGTMPIPVGVHITQSDTGTFWLFKQNDLTWSLYDSTTLAILQGPVTSGKFVAPPYTAALVNGHFIDAVNDRMVANITNNPATPVNIVGIFDWTSGALLGTCAVAGIPTRICKAGYGQAYCMNSDGMITLVDYLRGKTLGVMRLSGVSAASGGANAIAYDFARRRLLACFMSPDNADGSSSISIRGFYPINRPDRVAPPLALHVPRAGRTVPVVARVYGNAGEPVSGITGGFAFDPPADMACVPPAPSSDGTGHLRTQAQCNTESAVAATVTVAL